MVSKYESEMRKIFGEKKQCGYLWDNLHYAASWHR